KHVLRQLDGGDRLPEIVVTSLPHQDWNRLWAQSITPLFIGSRIVIRPSWKAPPVCHDQIEIVLDPKQAFGTGHHATTRLLLEWLEQRIHGGESVLDVGTGSGLLAMVAVRLGAAHAVGIDHDPVAIDCAREYARLNRFGDELQLRCQTIGPGERMFDLVLANLDRNTLVGLADNLTGCTRRTLLVSGILLDQRQDVREAFAGLDFYVRSEKEVDGWLAMEFERPRSCEPVSL
ncbi:MAG TPA: 50S ribosomal protein L11 methyltransferase, partial [Nitrospira sp.]